MHGKFMEIEYDLNWDHEKSQRVLKMNMGNSLASSVESADRLKQ